VKVNLFGWLFWASTMPKVLLGCYIGREVRSLFTQIVWSVAAAEQLNIQHFFASVAMLPSNNQAVSITNHTASSPLNHFNTA
jgi:hypothetical protein